MKYIKFLFFICVLYAYIHNPVLSLTKIGSIKLLYLLIPLSFFLYYIRFKKTVRIFKKETGLFLSFFIFSVFRVCIGGDRINIYTNFLFFIEAFLLPISILVLFINTNNNGNKLEYEFWKILLCIGCVASTITVVCVLNPTIGDYVRYELMYTEKDSALYLYTFRGFGFSDSLTYSYGVIQGIMLVFGIRFFSEHKWVSVFYIFLLISIILNARTGLVIVFVGICCYLISYRRFSAVLTVGVLLYIFAAALPIMLSNFDSSTVQWLAEFMREVNGVTSSRSITGSDTANTLINEMAVWPDDIYEWILGKGFIIYRTTEKNSDVGYFQQLNYGGLIYIFLIIRLLSFMYSRLKKYSVELFIILFFFAVFLVANLKGNYIFDSGAFRLMVLVYMFYILKPYYTTLDERKNK